MKKKPQNRSLKKDAVERISNLQTLLNNSIHATCQIAPFCCTNPDKNFTRNRKLPFYLVIKQILAFQNESLQNELIDLIRNQKAIPTKSALIQQRHKIRTEAFDFVYHRFMSQVKLNFHFRGYSLYACDGSVVNLPWNPDDQLTSVSAKSGAKSNNCIHLNALFNLINQVYNDYRIDRGAHMKEVDALYEIAPAFPILSAVSSLLTEDTVILYHGLPRYASSSLRPSHKRYLCFQLHSLSVELSGQRIRS